jgi:hypothetical protein
MSSTYKNVKATLYQAMGAVGGTTLPLFTYTIQFSEENRRRRIMEHHAMHCVKPSPRPVTSGNTPGRHVGAYHFCIGNC